MLCCEGAVHNSIPLGHDNVVAVTATTVVMRRRDVVVPTLWRDVPDQVDVVVEVAGKVAVHGRRHLHARSPVPRRPHVGGLLKLVRGLTDVANKFTLRHFVLHVRRREVHGEQNKGKTEHRSGLCGERETVLKIELILKRLQFSL